MKGLFAAFLALNFLVEAFAAFALITGPGGISAAGSGNQWSMHYGFAVLAIASASLWVWPRRADYHVVTAVLGVLVVFHCAVAISLATAGDQKVGLVIHTVFAALSVLLFGLRARWCNAPISQESH
ncbi:MAG TPA: hypothetical protein DCR65_00060 [Gammaproteobacteria bacterium]|jgi:hypothetical protein|nr:hypothetical protein [Gammaproteobacteria bacterium]